jgi:hypothetical protein
MVTSSGTMAQAIRVSMENYQQVFLEHNFHVMRDRNFNQIGPSEAAALMSIMLARQPARSTQ